MSISSDDFEVAPVFRGCIPLSKILLFRHHLKVFQFLTKKLIFVKEISIDKEQVVVIEQNIEKLTSLIPWKNIQTIKTETIKFPESYKSHCLPKWLKISAILFAIEIKFGMIILKSTQDKLIVAGSRQNIGRI